MIVSSIVSRVVPRISLTIARSSPRRALSSVDLPALGAPTIATCTPCLIALPAWKVAIRLLMVCAAEFSRAVSCERSANSSSSWSAKSSSSSSSEVNVSSCSRSSAILPDTPPRNWLRATSFSAAEEAAIRSATASACARSIRPLRNARLVNSPLSAIRAPASMSRRTSSCWTKRLPWQLISTVSSPVKECGARNTVQTTVSNIGCSLSGDD